MSCVTKGPICKIGRREENCLSFPSDGSISRNHAEIHIDCDRAFIKDLGSKFGTTIRCNESGIPRNAGCDLLEIKSGQEATFGRLSATVRFMKVCITICITRLDKKGKREVELAASHIGGLILQFPDDATHIVTNSICGATAKIMSGIVFKKSIVTTDWLVFANTQKPSAKIPSVTRLVSDNSSLNVLFLF